MDYNLQWPEGSMCNTKRAHTLVVLSAVLEEAAGSALLTLGLLRCCSSLLATDAAPRSSAAWKAELSAGFFRSNVAPAWWRCKVRILPCGALRRVARSA